MKKIKNRFFTKNALIQYPIFKRILHTMPSFEARDGSGKLGSLILPTENDYTVGKYINKIHYKKESYVSLVKAISEFERNIPLLIIKVNQSVIDYEQYIKTNGKLKIPKFPGHVIAGAFSLVGNELIPDTKTLISKVSTDPVYSFQSPDKIMTRELITNNFRANRGLINGSHEFYWVTRLDKTNVCIETLRERGQKLRKENKPYDLMKDACGQSIYTLLTGKILGSDVSTQLSARYAMLDAIDRSDSHFIQNLNKILYESKIDRKGHLLDYDNQNPGRHY